MAEVADKAGVSVSTVSHVLSGTRPVSDVLTRRVREAIDASGYSPNAVARSLATSTTRILGMVVSVRSDPFFAPVFSAMETTARNAGYSILLSDNSHNNPELDERHIRLMLDHQVSGLVLAPLTSSPPPVFEMLLGRKVPTVLLDRLIDRRFDQVGAENVEATAGLVAHLVEAGRHRIAFIAGRSGLQTTIERVEGYKLGLRRSGLRYERNLVRGGDSRADRAYSAMLRLLDTTESPTAVISGNAEMTVGVLRALRDVGYRIPDDIAAVSFDDVAHGDLMSPSLTALVQPVGDIGRNAIELLIARMNDRDLKPRERRLTPLLAHRRSCGCPEAVRAGDTQAVLSIATAGAERNSNSWPTVLTVEGSW